MKEDTNKNYIGSIVKCMRVLSLIGDSNDILGITKISRTLNLSIGSVQRITNTLEKLGYLSKDKNKQGYILGHKAWILGLSITKDFDLQKIAHPYIEELSHDTGETVNLSILDGKDIVCVDTIKTKKIVNVKSSRGSRLPSYCTAMGKCLLAFLPMDKSSELLNMIIDMKDRTPNTIIDKDKLLDELQEIRKRGYSINDMELEIDLRAIAVPLRDESQTVIASLSIAVPASRVTLEDLCSRFLKKLIDTATIISECMGYKQGLSYAPWKQ